MEFSILLLSFLFMTFLCTTDGEVVGDAYYLDGGE